MRGKVRRRLAQLLKIRITPAYAGKSETLSGGTRKIKDHPCVCGEKAKTVKICLSLRGSPLRMRGKVTLHTCSPVPVGITPAYAGKSGLEFVNPC